MASLAKGIEVEREHAGSLAPLLRDSQLLKALHVGIDGVAAMIAVDHLLEFPDYYERLAKMEREARKAQRGRR